MTLPDRLKSALVGQKIIVIRRTQREVHLLMEDDARNIAAVMEPTVKLGPSRITLPNGGQILYFSASNAERQCRGRQADMVDGSGFLDPDHVKIILHAREVAT